MPKVKTKRSKWYQIGLNFECTQCGNCCSGPPGYVWVTKKEIKAIAEHLGHADGQLGEEHLRRVGLRHSLTERPNGDCIFLKRTSRGAKCTIYPVRPSQCQTWPFWSGNLRSADAWNEASMRCPGMGRGRHYSFVEIEEIRLRK